MRVATWSSYFFCKNKFFRILNFNNYFLLVNTFSDQLLLADKYFSVQMLLQMSYFFRISNYLEHVIFGSRQFIQTATFSEKKSTFLEAAWRCYTKQQLGKHTKHLHGSRYSLRTITFSEKLILHNQLRSISTWKDFPLAIICSFKYTMNDELVWHWNFSILYCWEEQAMY